MKAQAMPYLTRAETPDGDFVFQRHASLKVAKAIACELSLRGRECGELVYVAVDVLHENDPQDVIASYTDGRA